MSEKLTAAPVTRTDTAIGRVIPLVPVAAPETFLDTPGLADLFRVTTRTVEGWRTTGFGPPYLKLGRRVLYPLSRSLAWAETRLRTSTSQVA